MVLAGDGLAIAAGRANRGRRVGSRPAPTLDAQVVSRLAPTPVARVGSAPGPTPDAQLAALVDASSEAILSADAAGRIITWNRAAAMLYGYAEAEAVGESVNMLTPPAKMRERRRLLAAVKRGEPRSAVDTQGLHRDGSLLEISLTLSRIVDGGVVVGFCAVSHDIGHRVRSRDRLEERFRERTNDLFRSRAETLHSLALAAELRDYDTAQHTKRVGENSAQVARELRLSRSFVRVMAQAAPLHDVGKIGIPDEILLKPGSLTEDERLTMQQHTVLGSQLLAGSEGEILQLGEEIALTHHERWDGAGYPAGVAGAKIPIAGRIVAVVDAFDAMTHDRPYRAARSIGEAETELSRCSGGQFDPEVVKAFLKLRHPPEEAETKATSVRFLEPAGRQGYPR
jgi:putative two-component system response regulator